MIVQDIVCHILSFKLLLAIPEANNTATYGMDQEVQALKEALLNATQTGIPTAIQQALSLEDTRHLLWQSIAALKAEPTLLEVSHTAASRHALISRL